MTHLAKIFVAALVLVLWGSLSVWAGQNASAEIRIDLNPAAGNQSQNYTPSPGAGTRVSVDIYVTGASNLDTYEFLLNYPASDLTFQQIGKDKSAPNFERNYLNRDNPTWTVLFIDDVGTHGEVSVSGSLTGNHGEDSPDGEGLLASIWFECKVDVPGKLTFGPVKWLDNSGIQDLCADKGDASLPIELSLFEAEAGEGQVLLKWITESEIDNLGFNLYRAREREGVIGEYVQINAELIKGAGNSPIQHSYQFVDCRLLHEGIYWYRLEDVGLDGTRTLHNPLSVTMRVQEEVAEAIPTVYKLYQNCPNPFNPATTVVYDLPQASHVILTIYTVSGQRIKTFIKKVQQPGHYSVTWDGRDEQGKEVGCGVLFYRLQAGEFEEVKKMCLIK